MTLLRLWAPNASAVDLVKDPDGRAERFAMSIDDAPVKGWWQVQAPVAHGTDYGYSLARGPVRPDPRSPWQPHGVHGPSRMFDTDQFAWSDAGFAGVPAHGAVFYELHVGTFTPEGTLDAAIGRLDHLSDLGVSMVELMPVAAFPGRWGWGYDGVALYAVHEQYGGPAALQRFVDACHARGMGVCLDCVYNHLGPDGNYLAEFGPYFTDRHETPWGAAVNLDADGNGGMREFIVDNALRWLRDFHVDALRLDAVHALLDESPEHILAELSRRTAELAGQVGRPLSLIAESDLNDAVMVTGLQDGGLGMTAQWDDDFHHCVHAAVTGERDGYYCDFGSLETLAKCYREVFVHDGGMSTFRGREWGAKVDTERFHGGQFLVYTATHDQVGNRATGDRPTATITAGQAALSAALVLTGPYTPMLFMGEEWQASTPWQFFTDHNPELGALVSEGRRREFSRHGWDPDRIPDPQAPSSREDSVLRWSELDDPVHARMLNWYRDLIALRSSEPELNDMSLSGLRVDVHEEQWLVAHRGALRVVANFASGPVTVPLDRPAQTVILAWDPVSIAGASVTIPGHGSAVIRTA